MEAFLNVIKGIALFFFAAGIVLSVLALLQSVFDFPANAWLDIRLLRLYLFMAVTGILIYILIRFRRRKEN